MEMEGEEKMGRIVLALTMIMMMMDGSVYCIVLYIVFVLVGSVKQMENDYQTRHKARVA